MKFTVLCLSFVRVWVILGKVKYLASDFGSPVKKKKKTTAKKG